MPSFASGKKAYFISDRSGFRYPYSSMKIEWTGAAVGPDEFEPKHPQLNPRRQASDPQALRLAKVDRTEPSVIRLLTPDCFKSGTSGSSIITVTEPSHGRSTADSVRFRKVNGFDGFTKANLELSTGYSITVVDENTYTFSIPSETATVGNIRGGGEVATVGDGTSTAPTTASTFDSTSVTLDSATKTFDEG
jgi:hypothetical protein|tara:strand:+ start:3761 stop:4336 length:576 start_codon:yes stop_codon:yes gene_type:complete